MESRKEAEISNALFDMLDDPFNAKLPDLAVVNLYKLAKDRRIWLDIAVDDNTLEWEKQILLWNMEDHGVPAAQRKPIWIYLFNYGGSFDMEWSFIDLIDASATPIYTVNPAHVAWLLLFAVLIYCIRIAKELRAAPAPQ